MPENSPGFLPPGGNYRELLSYRKSEIIYDFTFRFCGSFLKKGDRTVDQMVQAARSGKQNIAEGSKASATSTETEIKLTNVARASLEELLIDYQDFLRVRDHPQWDKNSKEARAFIESSNIRHATIERDPVELHAPNPAYRIRQVHEDLWRCVYTSANRNLKRTSGIFQRSQVLPSQRYNHAPLYY